MKYLLSLLGDIIFAVLFFTISSYFFEAMFCWIGSLPFHPLLGFQMGLLIGVPIGFWQSMEEE